MPDATNTVTVDGVEPSILVQLLNISDNPHKVKVFNSDDGGERWIEKGGDPVLLTPSDLAALGAVGVEIINTSEDVPVEKDSTQTSEQEVVKLPLVNPLGQSSQQV